MIQPIRKSPWLWTSVIAFSIVSNLLLLTGPLFMLQIYDRVLTSRSEETLVALLVLVAGLFILMGVLDFARGRLLAVWATQLQARLDPDVFEKSVTGKSAKATPDDVNALAQSLGSSALLAVIDLPWAPLFVCVIYIFHPFLGILALVGMCTLVILTGLHQTLSHAKTRKAMKVQAQAQRVETQMRRAADYIRTSPHRQGLTQLWQGLRSKSQMDSFKSTGSAAGFASFTRTLRLFLQSLMLALGAYLVLQNALTAGAMIASSIILSRAMAPVEQGLAQWPALQRGYLSYKRIQAILNEEGTDAAAKRTSLPTPIAHLTAKDVAVVPNGSQRAVLAGISFTLTPGTALGVIGKSASGKSTLARTIMGHIPIAAGEIRLDGARIDQYGDHAIADHIGYVPQDVTLFDGTIAQNICGFDPSAQDTDIVKAAQSAGAHDMILAFKDGYDTHLTDGSGILSGGQKQRIALARALYADPVLVVMDEPNAALDADGARALNGAVEALKSAGKAAILMTHRPSAIAAVDHLLVLENGRMRAFGPRDEVLATVLQNTADVHGQLSAQSQGGA